MEEAMQDIQQEVMDNLHEQQIEKEEANAE